MNLVTKILDIKTVVPNKKSQENLFSEMPLNTFDICDESLCQNFVLIHGGEFTMGSPEGEFLRGSDEAQHQVWVSDFSLCRYAVTVAEFRRFLEASGYGTDVSKSPIRFINRHYRENVDNGVNWFKGVSGRMLPKSEDNHPVVHVNWHDAVAYCQWLTEKTGQAFRLPTEAEWEYACRAGTTTPFHTGEKLTTLQANHNKNNSYHKHRNKVYQQNTVPINYFSPNASGVYNMHGNVWEWCSDWYGGSYYNECKSKGTVANPEGPETGLVRVLRGGGWDCDARLCRSAYRFNSRPYLRENCVGFRLVSEQ